MWRKGMKAKKPKWKRRKMGSNYESILTGQHPKLVTAIAGRRDFGDEAPLELRVVLDPRTGKRWTSVKAMREWLNKAIK